MLRRAYHKAKAVARAMLGRELLVRPQLACRTERLGSSFGGWIVCPDLISRNSIVYSLGVGRDISFDLDLILRFGVVVHAFDPTPSSLGWLGTQKVPEQFVMHDVAVSDFNGPGVLIPPVDPRYYPHTLATEQEAREGTIPVVVKRLESIMRGLGHESIDLLKMDIEGSEYRVIADMHQSDIRPQQLLVEFHHRFPGIGLEKTRVALRQLGEMGYRLFAISDNHQEYSFTRQKPG